MKKYLPSIGLIGIFTIFFITGTRAQSYATDYPTTSEITNNSVTVESSVTNIPDGSTYRTLFIIQAASETAPTTEAVIAQSADSNGGTISLTTATPSGSTSITGLDAATVYNIYLVTVDANDDLVIETTDNPTLISFTTLAIPTITEMTPNDGATGVNPGDDLVLTFKEEITAGTGYIQVFHDGTYQAIPVSNTTISTNQLTISSADLSLDYATDYYILVDAGIVQSYDNGISFAGITDESEWNFRTDDFPTIDTTDPSYEETNVPVNSNLTLTFNKNITAGTGNIVIANESETIATIPIASEMISEKQLTIDLSAVTLEYGTNYHILMDAGVVLSSTSAAPFAGISDAGTWNFSTPAFPSITDRSPEISAQDVPLSSDLTLTFNDDIAAGTGDIQIVNENTGVPQNIDITDNTYVSFSGSQMTINNAAFTLEYNTQYHILIDGTAIKTATGDHSFAGITDTTEWVFSTPYGPTIPDRSPADGAENISIDSNLTLTFSETITAGTGNIVIANESDTIATIPVTAGTISVDQLTMTIDLSAVTLEYGTNYHVLMDAGAVQSSNGVPFAGISDADTWNFSTPAFPTVTDRFPEIGAENIDLSSDLTLTFDDAIAAGTGYIRIVNENTGTPQNIDVTDNASVTFDNENNQVTIGNAAFTLDYNTQYHILIDGTAIKTATGDHYFAGISDTTEWVFSTPYGPTITDRSPAVGAENISIDSNLTLTFSESITAVAEKQIQIVNESGSIASIPVTAETISEGQLTIDLSDGTLEYGTNYHVLMDEGAVQSSDGVPFAGISDTTEWAFSTPYGPTIDSTTPSNGATDVLLDADLEITFNESIEFDPEATEGFFHIKKDSGDNDQDILQAGLEISGNTLKVKSDVAQLAYGTHYHITIDAGAIRSVNSKAPFTGITNTTEWNFSTPDRPTITALSPENNSTGVLINSDLTLTFSEPITAETGNILITNESGTITTIPATSGTINNNQLTISNSLFTLELGTLYHVLIDANAITSTLDAPFAGISDESKWSFTTLQAPVIESLSPKDDAINVPINSELVITFNEPITTGSGQYTLHTPEFNKPYNITAANISGNQLTLDLNDDGTIYSLKYGASYSITMDAGLVQTVDGDHPFAGFSDETIWNFSTPARPTITDRYPADDATGVAVGIDLTLTFSDTIKAGTGNIQIVSGTNTQTLDIAPAMIEDRKLTIPADNITLDYNTNYHILMDEGAVLSYATDAPFAGITDATEWNFSTAAFPTITNRSPADDATGVAVNTDLTLTFSEAIAAGSGDIRIIGGTSPQTLDTAKVIISGTLLTIPADSITLDYGTDYHILIDEGFVLSDATDAPFAGITEDSEWNFSTIDFPTIINRTPADDAIDISADTDLTLTFSDDIAAGSGNIEIVSDNNTETLDITKAVISGTLLTIPADSITLDYGTNYHILIDEGFVLSDATDAHFAGITDATEWNFSTAGFPTITDRSPADDTTGVAVNTDLTLTFSEVIVAGTGNIQIVSSTNTETLDIATAEISGTRLTIPANSITLDYGTDYHILIDEGFVQSESTDAPFAGITEDSEWNFSTIAFPTITDRTPADDATGVAVDTDLTLTFSDDIAAGSGNIEIVSDNNTQTLDITKAVINGTLLTISADSITLDYGTDYHILITAGAITTADGVYSFTGISDATEWNFSTPAFPTISEYSPADDATDVAVDTDLTLTFSETIVAGTGNIQIVSSTNTETLDIATAEISGTLLTISADSITLDYGTDYYVLMDAGVVHSSTSGAPFAGISDAGTWNFSTATIPTITSSSPADNESDVSITTDLVITFSENIVAGSGYAKIVSPDGSHLGISVSNASIVDKQLTLANALLKLNYETEYYLLIDPGFVVSKASGVAFEGISDPTVLNFTIERQGPKWADGYPNLSDQDASTLTLNGETDMDGQYFYVITDNETPPGEAQIESGNNEDGQQALLSGTDIMTAGTPFTAAGINISTLTMGSDYYLHVVAKNDPEGYSLISTLTIDRTGPTIASSYPANGYEHMPVSEPIQIIYDEMIYSTEGDTITGTNAGNYFALEEDNGTSLSASISVNTEQLTVTLNPDITLTENTSYRVVIDKLKDQYGNEQTDAYTLLFTTDLTNIWTGGGNANTWEDASNWDSTYVPNKSVLIPASAISFPTISSGEVDVNNLTVEAGASLTLSGGTLDIDGLFILESSADGNATFLPKGGTLEVVAGHVRFEQAVSSGSINYNICSPVSGATVSGMGLGSGNHLYYFDNTEGGYALQDDDSPLELGRGYIFRNNTDVTFIGTPHMDDVEIPVYRTAQKGLGWNLIGNPFSASMDWGAVTLEKVENSFWVWLNDQSTYAVYNGDMGLGVNTTLGSGIIPSHQAFWVKVVGGLPNNTGSVTIPISALQANTTSYLKSAGTTKTTKYPSLKIASRLNNHTDEMAIALTPASTDGTMHFKSDKMLSGNANLCEIFTLEGNQKLAINGLDEADSVSVDMGYSAKATGPCELLVNLNTLPGDMRIYIKDKTKNTMTEVNEDTPYSFDIETAGTNTSRFAVVLKTGTVTGLLNNNIDKDIDKPYIYADKSELVALVPGTKKANYQLFDISGRVLDNGIFQCGTPYRIPVTHKGVVVLRVQWEQGSTEFKAVF